MIELVDFLLPKNTFPCKFFRSFRNCECRLMINFDAKSCDEQVDMAVRIWVYQTAGRFLEIFYASSVIVDVDSSEV